MKNEIWKAVPEFEGYYEASNFGRIRKICGKILKQSNSHGYLCVRFTKNKKRSVHLSHRIIAKTFIENINNYLEINHIDAIKQNNNIKNLEWCSRKQNVKHANDKNLINYSKKLSFNDAEKIRKMVKEGQTVTSVASKFKISVGTCSAIKNYKHWKTKTLN